jgi:hypothetical protein
MFNICKIKYYGSDFILFGLDKTHIIFKGAAAVHSGLHIHSQYADFRPLTDGYRSNLLPHNVWLLYSQSEEKHIIGSSIVSYSFPRPFVFFVHFAPDRLRR